MDRSLPRDAAVFLLDANMVHRCLDQKDFTDQLFSRACANSLSMLAPSERRGALSGVTGHVAESVVELLLDNLGYHML